MKEEGEQDSTSLVTSGAALVTSGIALQIVETNILNGFLPALIILPGAFVSLLGFRKIIK